MAVLVRSTFISSGGANASGIQCTPHRRKYSLEHNRRQPTCVRIVSRAVVACRDRVCLQDRSVAVPERMHFYPPAQSFDCAVVGNLAQRHDGCQLW